LILSRFTYLALPPMSFIYSILAIELMLKWNSVSNVYTLKSIGQLIPFVIGVAGLLKVLYDVRKKYEVGTPTFCFSLPLPPLFFVGCFFQKPPAALSHQTAGLFRNGDGKFHQTHTNTACVMLTTLNSNLPSLTISPILVCSHQRGRGCDLKRSGTRARQCRAVRVMAKAAARARKSLIKG
jgi:hypothetical protein